MFPVEDWVWHYYLLLTDQVLMTVTATRLHVHGSRVELQLVALGINIAIIVSIMTNLGDFENVQQTTAKGLK
jgi:hypothetical protein